MRFGTCATPDSMPMLARAGYDFAEWPVVHSLQPEQSRSVILTPLQALLMPLPIGPEVWYLFLPGDLHLVGEVVDEARIQNYLAEACARASLLGGRVLVLGSSGARQIPPGFSRTDARHQMLRALTSAAEAAAPHTLVVALEPMSADVSNHVNSIAEAVEYVREAAHPALGIVADLHHMTQDKQPMTDVLQAGTLLTHVHVAGEGRRAPAAADTSMLAEFFAVLKQANYAGRVSIEADWRNLDTQAAEALDTLRNAWEMA